MTILAGYRDTDGDFNNKGDEENFWSYSPASVKDKAHYCYLNRGNNTPKFNTNSREFGFGVLLFKDKNTILLGNQLMLQITDLFQAYYDCRKNKRNSYSAIKFELNYESSLITLYNEIIERKYKIGKSTVFIVKDPVKREVFAADFRDRIVHHLIINKINPILEKMFIFDSYSCRIGKGTSFGIKRIKKFIRSCSDNYEKDCYILKLDIEGFFMNIDKNILKKKCLNLFKNNIDLNNETDLIYLINEVIYSNPTKDFILKGTRDDWKGLPKSKSLFYSKPNTGLPIGNLSSQIFANLYLHELDIFIKKELKIKYYGRYVDDFILIHEDKEYLKECIIKIRFFISNNLKLNLHPKKIYLQHYSKGVKFLGAYIKPYRVYIGNRTKGNFYKKIQEINQIIGKDKAQLRDKQAQKNILSKINSYLGLIRHYNTFKLRKKLLFALNAYIWNYFYISEKYKVLTMKIRKVLNRKK